MATVILSSHGKPSMKKLFFCIANYSGCGFELADMQGKVEWGADRGPPVRLDDMGNPALFAAVFEFPTSGESQAFSLTYQEQPDSVSRGGSINFAVTIYDDRILFSSLCPSHREVHHHSWDQHDQFGYNIQIY